MNSKRSYLDSLNTGRQRRPSSTIEEIGRTLDAIGARLDRAREEPRPVRGSDRTPSERGSFASPYQEDLLARDFGRSGSYRPHLESSMQDLARTMESSRRQEESVASVSRIATELKGMREEIRQQMGSGMQREFQALRDDIERAWKAAQSGGRAEELTAELERLSDAIASLAKRSDDRGVGMLRGEFDQVKEAIGRLAREESVTAVERRWDEFDRRFDAFEQRVATGDRRQAPDPAIEALSARLDEIGSAVHNLPESLSLRSMEDKVRTLAQAVDQFARQQQAGGPAAFEQIEERLDEIARAIVASSVSPQSQAVQAEQFERIEARIASLARQIEELSDDRPSGEIIDRINMLSLRVDELARESRMPDQALEQLAHQVATIADRVDAGFASSDTEAVVRGLESRFASLSDMIQAQQGESAKRGHMIFRQLESRIEELARQMERNASVQGGSEIGGLEARLEDISARLEKSSRQVSDLDPDLIRNLETQVSSLSQHLRSPAPALPEFDDISPRLEQIERSIAGSRDAILDSARAVAEQTIRQIAGSRFDTASVDTLAQDLRALDALTRKSDERNARTFEAIHDTLLKIVDRLSTLEDHKPVARSLPAVSEAPPLQPADTIEPLQADMRQPPRRSPAEAAAAAATAALEEAVEDEETAEPAAKRSMIGGLAKAFNRRKEAVKPTVLAGDPPMTDALVDIDEPIDPKAANQPLEPGSGTPDLGTIMKRVRDERARPTETNETEAAKSDFIAAARRAAQAAAAQADIKKKGIDVAGIATSSGLGSIFKNHRKTALMAAGTVVLALAGLQLGKAFIAEGEPSAVTASDVETLAAQDEPLDIVAAAPRAPRAEDIADARQAAPTPEARPAIASTPVTSAPVTDASTTAALTKASPVPAVIEQALPEAEATDLPEEQAVVPIVVPLEAGPQALREAAESGDPKALFEIGSRYAEGRGTKADLAEAAKWYEKAAEAGFAPAQYRIGNFYEKGTGVARDIAKAKTWYQMAAEQGNASAMHNLAVLFAMGADGTTDNESAGRWFTKAADLGVKDSQYNLGILAAKGVGVPQNLEDSYKWFALVAKSGDKDAAQKRDEVANALRPEQLQQARATTEGWKPNELDIEANDISIPDGWTESPSNTASIDMKQAIRNIQTILNKNGYDAGSADGVMGDKTTAAIALFQKDSGMSPTGQITEELVRALLAKK